METFIRNDLHGPEGTDLGTAILANLNTDMETIDNSLAKGNWGAVVDPVVGDDVLDGYAIGSLWMNVAAHRLYICESASTGAAVWRIVWEPYPGWIAETVETWTYAGADAPSFTFTITGDHTTKYFPGMKICLTNATTKYFIITKVAYSDPSTTITIYGGTDYVLVDAAITALYYSVARAPVGFPMQAEKWSVIVVSNDHVTQANPVNGTKYNLGGLGISIPIGAWRLSYMVEAHVTRSVAGEVAVYATLSSAADTESDITMTCAVYATPLTGTLVTGYRTKLVTVTTKTAQYLNAYTSKDDQTLIGFLGNQTTTLIVAESVYL